MGTLWQKNRQAGFSLLECIVVLCIMAIVLWVSVPALDGIYEQQLLEQQTRLLEEQLVWLRSEAQRQEIPTALKVVDKHSYAVSLGTGNNCQTKSYEVIHKRLALSSNAQEHTIGFSRQKTSFQKCTLTIQGKRHARHIVVSNLGRIRVEES